MNKYFCILAFLFISLISDAQLYRQHLSNFTPKDYGQKNSLYTQAVIEDKQGIIYVGSAYGILQYDGISWRTISIDNIRISSLACLNNTIFVGGQSDFGFLILNSKGKFEYQSLAKTLPLKYQKFSEIWKTLVWKDKIVFQSDEAIFIYSPKKLQIIKPKTSFHLAFVEGENLFVKERNLGLMHFEGGDFKLVNNGNLFADFGVFAILPLQNLAKLVVTQEFGLWSWVNNDFSKITLPKELEEKLSSAKIIGAKALLDGNFALYSEKNGIFILDKKLELIANYSLSSGMRSSEVRDIAQDHNGNIWMATQKGVNRLQYSSPISTFSETSGLHGNVQALAIYGKTLFVGTSDGLFENVENGSNSITEISQIKSTVWSMKNTQKDVWIGTENGIWIYDGKKYLQSNSSQSLALAYIPEQEWVVSSGKDGVVFYDALTKREILKIDKIKIDAYNIAYKILNDKSCEIWFGSKTSGVEQIHISKNLKYSFTSYYGADDGLPNDWVSALQMGNNIAFSTSIGLLKFVSAQEIYNMANDSTLNISDIRGYFDILKFPKNAENRSITAFYFGDKNSYANLDFYVNAISMKDSMPDDYDFKTIQLGRFNIIQQAENDIYIGGDDGMVIMRNLTNNRFQYPKPNLLIRNIVLGDDTIWYGDKSYSGKIFLVPYSKNNIQIDLASSYFENGVGPRFSWRIEGIDSKFSNWSTNSHILLLNLNEGEYKIHFLAKDIHDKVSSEIVLNFTVIPPWYRSFWAYLIYLILAVLFVYFLIQINIKRLKEKNRKLEEIVRIRTKEVVEQKEEIEIQKNKIEEILKNIRSSISYASRIQNALLPSKDFIEKYFINHFILFKPRDVVSGDFYWASQQNDKIIIAAADCTGHGVPGAFMSMLGMSLLNEIVISKGITEPAQILNVLRKGIISALKQKGEIDEQKDGMDISLIAIDLKQNTLQWAGANNPLWVVRKTIENIEFIEFKADKMPVAIHEKMPSFTNNSLEYFKKDRIFMFSDGFVDQFGGEKNKKFMKSKLKDLILQNCHLDMPSLKTLLNNEFQNWKGENNQVDDVVIIGIEL
ncbi:MAG: hypothetical protein AUJ98_03030 [Bacteroidetes bacterium CG2_30_33_31]|nr:MAG: hypothetical protein AUJ98_03030 [Bacteroidetes bacterium CG2_30_33_31]